jgi:hypothetical protein|tara:strand:- start:694 stop:921 length:228 start_codon:yes stop_codon:yes gene_type:complete
VELSPGDLIRWITDYDVYESSGDVVTPIQPIYAYGIVIEASKTDPKNVIVSQFSENGTLKMIHMIHDGFELVSKG